MAAIMHIVHLASGHSMSAQFNPTALEHGVQVIWNKFAALGASGGTHQYQSTDNSTLSFRVDFNAKSVRSLRVRGGLGREARGIFGSAPKRADLARRWLYAIHYPVRAAGSISRHAPSDLLYVWPNLFSLKVKPMGVSFSERRFDRETGAGTLFTAELQFEAVHAEQLTYEDVLQRGLQRHGGGS